MINQPSKQPPNIAYSLYLDSYSDESLINIYSIEKNFNHQQLNACIETLKILATSD